MKPKLYLDEDVHAELAEAMRKRGYDVVHTQEINRKGSTDVEQINYAIAQERCFLSHNIKDFVLLHNYFMKNNFSHFGIILSRQKPIREILPVLLKFLQSSSKENLISRIIFL